MENETNNTLGINIRPHLKQSLDLIKNDYNIVIYSSGSKNYVDAILDFIDPEHKTRKSVKGSENFFLLKK